MILTTILSTFLAGVVESIETYTVVLAAGITRGWMSALFGVLAGIAVLATAILTVGRVLTTIIPIGLLNVIIGTFLLLFGSRWLVKAILRYGGRKTLRDESNMYQKTHQRLQAERGKHPVTFDRMGFVATFGATLLEGAEIAFTIISFGAVGHFLNDAILGAAIGIIFVILLALVLQKPMAKAPENGIKFVVGIMLTALGTLWTGEGLGMAWAWGQASYVALISLLVAFSFIVIYTLRQTGHRLDPHHPAREVVK